MANFIRAANVASLGCYPPAREASREVAKFNERKNLHTPLYGFKEFVSQ